jgi:hypothetical protein
VDLTLSDYSYQPILHFPAREISITENRTSALDIASQPAEEERNKKR